MFNVSQKHDVQRTLFTAHRLLISVVTKKGRK